MTAKDLEMDGKKLKYPNSVFFIIVNEFCERFSYYGMKTVLGLYFRNILLYDESESTVYYHLFSMLCYFTPVFGAILADTYLGKFKTILYLSLLYACGNIILSIAAIPNILPQQEFSLLGLFIIAVGTGGIKPCVSAFGGDQFVRPQQDRQLEQFFSYFYISINAGSLLSTLLTPVLREDVQCFGQTSCFSLAFGVPAILMIIAVAVFFFGKWNYKIRPTEGNIMVDVTKCVSHAVRRKWSSRDEQHEHWLDYACDAFDVQLIQDIKQVLRVLVLYLPIPIFWALYDQQGSRWLFQATRMDGSLGSAAIKPDQIGIINPLLIIAITPLFNSVVYPLLKKCGIRTPLQKIGMGGVLIGVAFVISGLVELELEKTYPQVPAPGFTQLNFINTLPCSLNITHDNEAKRVEANNFAFQRNLKEEQMHFKISAGDLRCGNIELSSPEWNGQVKGASSKAFPVVIMSRSGKIEVARMHDEESLEKSNSGLPRLRFIYNLDNDAFDIGNITIKMENSRAIHFPFNGSNLMGTLDRVISTGVREVPIGIYDVYIPRRDGKVNTDDPAGQISVLQGGSYTVVIQRTSDVSASSEDYNVILMEVTPASTVHMVWLLPQYFIITAGEVMFSVTGLQFSFTQAPASMQSLMQAAWLLNVAFGNLIVTVVAKAKLISRQSMEFFLFAGLIALDIVLFAFLAARYTYVEVDQKTKDEKSNEKSKEEGGEVNQAFATETQI